MMPTVSTRPFYPRWHETPTSPTIFNSWEVAIIVLDVLSLVFLRFPRPTLWQDYPKFKSQRLSKAWFPSQQHASHVSTLSERNKGNFKVFPPVAQVSTIASARQSAPVGLSKVCKIGKGYSSRYLQFRGPKNSPRTAFSNRSFNVLCGISVFLVPKRFYELPV